MKKMDYQLLENYMYSCMGDSAHDREHIYRVLYNALAIAETEQAVDYDVLIAACLLHDIGRQDQFADPKVCHARVGSEKAYRFLVDNGFHDVFAQEVADCIRTHRFRKEDAPQSLEAKILFDADKLDVTGAVGIARTLMYKGDQVEPLYVRRQDGSVSGGEDDRVSSFFREYKFKLEKIYDCFLTRTGTRLALERRRAAVQFYEALYREVNAVDESGKAGLRRLLEE